ncbi:MAG: hypothetical protein F4213_09285 [Boseongicola sp. SB0677_bin_26]|nr:hypothetical protein [Boseongicola sp. SB0665_bin_10]MYG26204.1 hypothetical protein [Boseongicola sp. SB0677_bin_26]
MTVSALPLRPSLLAAAGAAVLLATLGIAASSGLILGNATTSVPRGLYLRADPGAATYVTFCLGERHRARAWYRSLCSPDDPDGVRILKRVRKRRGAVVIVEGDVPRALDSDALGPVRRDEIRGWWRPLILVGARSDGD